MSVAFSALAWAINSRSKGSLSYAGKPCKAMTEGNRHHLEIVGLLLADNYFCWGFHTVWRLVRQPMIKQDTGGVKDPRQSSVEGTKRCTPDTSAEAPYAASPAP